MPWQDEEKNKNSDKRIIFGYYMAFALLLISFVLMFITNSKQNSHAKQVDQTNSYERALQALLAEMRSAEAAVRGYLIIQDRSLLLAHEGSEARADSILKESYRWAPADEQRPQLDTISDLLKQRYALFTSVLDLFNRVEGDSIVGKVREGKAISDRLQQKISEVGMAHLAALQLNKDRLEMYSNAVLPVNIFTLVLAVLLAAYSFITYNKEKHIAAEANRIRHEKEKQLELKVEELRKANDELVKFRRLEKFAATGRMARIIAHEVRNPLSNINLAISQLKDDEPVNGNENAVMMYDIITRSSERINQLVTDLLNATRIHEMSFASASVNALLDEALTAAADRAQLRQVQVIKEYAAELCNINADKEKLKIAFLNIIVNAIEAMEPGKGILLLKTENKDGKCMIMITDNGKGIDKDSLSKLFEPYFTSKPRGSGLGLANTQAIILTHKGSIEVESEPGRGTTFTVTLEFAN